MTKIADCTLSNICNSFQADMDKIVLADLITPQACEELSCFSKGERLILCGLWRFTIAYKHKIE